MARCGCNQTCACAVEAGSGVTVTGNGSPASPYKVSAVSPVTVTDTNTVDLTKTGDDIKADVIVSPDAGNQLSALGNGLFSHAEVDGSDCIKVDGDGSVATPFVVTPIIAPEPNGLECTPAGLAVIPSADAGNTMTIGTDGRLFTPAGGGGGTLPTVGDTDSVDLTITPAGLISADVKVGCGLEVDASGVNAKTGVWGYTCPQDVNATKVYCSPTTGQLQGEPEYKGMLFRELASGGAGVLNPADPKRCITVTATIDTSAWCENTQGLYTVQTFFNLTLGAGDAYVVTSEISINGGAFNISNIDRDTNASGSSIQRRYSNGGVLGQQLPGIYTITARTCIDNIGATALTVNLLGVDINGHIYTFHG